MTNESTAIDRFLLCVAYLFAALASLHAGDTYAQTGLPWTSSFESGDFSEWNGFSQGDVQISSTDAAHGTYSATIPIVAGTLNGAYYEHYFGDHVSTGLERVNEMYLSLSSKFDSGYRWPRAESHKIAILNITDGQSYQRRYQVYVYVDSNGRYAVDHSYIDTWQFMGLAQNVGTPSTVNFDVWTDLKLYVRLNTPGTSNGVIRLWIDDELKLEHQGLNIRENNPFSINKLILSSYTSDSSGGDGLQWYDNWRMSETDSNIVAVVPNPPVLAD